MSLRRIWTPTDNVSGGGTKRILVIHTMEGFTGPNGAYDCATYFQKSSAGASSQVCIDNNRGTIWEGVTRANGAWTQCGYNSVAISCEQSGYASWSRDYWLNNRYNQLQNIAEWLAEEHKITGIPLTDITASGAQGSGTGVCYHSELGSYGCGHADPGSGWPIDKVLQWAREFAGGAPTEPPVTEPKPEDEDEMPYFRIEAKDVNSRVQEISLNGMHSNLGLGTDASTHDDSTGVRVAFHHAPHEWTTADVWSDNGGDKGHEKVVYTPKWGGQPRKFDIIKVTRLDDNPTDVIINIGK